MRLRRCIRTAAVLALALGGYIVPAGSGHSLLGVTPADAAHVYTRKRVNGRWITGSFTGSARSRRVVARRFRHGRVAYARLETPQDEPVGSGLVGTLAAPPAVTRADPAPAQLKGGADAPTNVETTSSLAPAEPQFDGERIDRLRSALQAKAQKLATLPLPASDPLAPTGNHTPSETDPAGSSVHGAAATSVPSGSANRPDPASLEPRSVSFDFQTGIKTTVFENSVVKEPFDPATIRRLAVPAR